MAQTSRKPVKTPSITGASSATIDPQAMALLQQVEKTMLNFQTYQAECATTLAYPAVDGKSAREKRQFARLLAAKPNKMHYDSWNLKCISSGLTARWERNTQKQGITFVCDGKTDWKQFGTKYRIDTFTQPEALHTVLEPWEGFYSPQSSLYYGLVESQKQHGLLELRRQGKETVEGTPCEKVFAHIRTTYYGEAQEYWQTWYISADSLVRRKVERIEFGGKPGYTRTATLLHIRTNAPIAAKEFTYTPPTGVVSAAKAERNRPALLATGSVAPDFTALDKDKRPVKLSRWRGKVVVLDFWASWCGPCVKSMPHTQEVARKLQAEGLPVVVLAVDNSEERDAFVSWLKSRGTSLSALTFAHIPPQTNVADKLYHVAGIPTQFVLDKNGVVRAAFVGYDGPTGVLEIAVRTALVQHAR